MSENEQSTSMTALARPDVPAEYGERDQIVAMGRRIGALLPGGNKMSDAEAMALAQYSITQGANPFRGEVYGYKDGRGQFHLVEGYKLLVRWAKAKCDYSEWFVSLEMDDSSIGFQCYILRNDKQDLLNSLLQAGMDSDKAIEIAASSAGGVVRAKEMAGPRSQPPSGWTWQDVAKKRALKNALQRSHGAPSPIEIAKESWNVEGHTTIPEDWKPIRPNMTPNEAEAEAAYNAKTRERHEREPTVTNAAEAMADVYGDDIAPAPEVVDGEIEDELPPMPHEWTEAEAKELATWWRNAVVINDETALTYLEVSKIAEFAGDIDAAKAKIHEAIAEETDQ
jgi:hypothetical protein